MNLVDRAWWLRKLSDESNILIAYLGASGRSMLGASVVACLYASIEIEHLQYCYVIQYSNFLYLGLPSINQSLRDLVGHRREARAFPEIKSGKPIPAYSVSTHHDSPAD